MMLRFGFKWNAQGNVRSVAHHRCVRVGQSNYPESVVEDRRIHYITGQAYSRKRCEGKRFTWYEVSVNGSGVEGDRRVLVVEIRIGFLYSVPSVAEPMVVSAETPESNGVGAAVVKREVPISWRRVEVRCGKGDKSSRGGHASEPVPGAAAIARAQR
nr:hypothetical protein Iba_chr06bCG15300 [Ipomoea batatas]